MQLAKAGDGRASKHARRPFGHSWISAGAYDPAMRSPKLAKDRTNDWYRYYAGYSPAFVEDALEATQAGTDGLVVDPWNGSGTTTAVAQSLGVPAVGYDINPALVVIARSRLLGPEVAASVQPLAKDLVDHAKDLRPNWPADPLLAWFTTASAQEIRRIYEAIHRILVDPSQPPGAGSALDIAAPSPFASLFFVALFHAVRSHVSEFVSSNPTWIKALAVEPKSLPPGAIYDSFSDACKTLALTLRTQPFSRWPAVVELASSSSIPLSNEVASAIITSPPYCTRIDYVVATRPELAVLGVSPAEARLLRDRMLGTPTIMTQKGEPDPHWGEAANGLIARVSAHSSRASATYYRTYYLQYLASMWQSFGELRRVLRKGGSAIIVIQDSYYKDIHVDLPLILSEMGSAIGLHSVRRTDFSTATMASINRSSRTWRANFRATESVLHLVRE